MENTKKLPPGPIQFEGQILDVRKPQSVLKRLLAEGLPIDHSCGGNATCGTCRVIVEAPLENLPERSEIETEFADERGFLANERLSCQLPCFQGLKISRP